MFLTDETTGTIGVVSACAHRLYLYRPELLDGLRESGFKVVVFGPEPQRQGDEMLTPHGFDYVQLPLERRKTNPFNEISAQKLITETVGDRHVRLLFSYGIRFAPLVNISAKAAGVPCVNVINGAGSLFITQGLQGAAKRSVILPYIRSALDYSSRIFFQNSDDLELFASLRLGKRERYVQVDGSGVNTQRFPALPLPKERVFGYLGRVNPEKGFCELLDAFRFVHDRFPDARLLIAGELDGIGSETQLLLDKLTARGAAEYLGEIDDVASFMERIRYFVFPSYREGTPRVTLEAMSCARPIITTDAVGCRETVRDGFNGLLVKPGDVATLADAMLLFCSDDALTEKMGMNSRSLAVEKFDVFKTNRVLIDTVVEVLKGSSV
ncbi:MAG: glycosyltransferase family 4 protein [Clostridia bacterium]|nr:glycosyltransferase family 4 protein [Clostridia bacterium]